MDNQAVQELLQVAKRLDAKGLVNAYEGNVSIMRDRYLYITPSGENKAWLTADMVAVFHVESGEQISGLKASSELKMHRAVYRMRNNIGGIVHTHAPFLTAYALCNMPFQSRSYAELIWDHKMVEVAPYGRPGSDAIYAGLETIFAKGRSAALLANHGVIVVGKTLIEAMNRQESIENAAKITFITRLMGEERELPQEEVELLLSL